MSDFASGNFVNCVLLDGNIYETKKEKLLVPYAYTIMSIYQNYKNSEIDAVGNF